MPETAASPGKVIRWGVVAAWCACAVTTLLYLGFKQFSYRYVAGDENIYYYMGKMMAEGKAWPYRDFFFAHPPMQLIVAAAAFKVFGASYAVARSLPILSGMAAGLAIFLIGWRRLGPLEAAVGQAAFLLSYGVLRNSSHYTGANLSLALVLWGFYLLIRRRDVWGGLVLALAAHTTVYAVPGVMMVLFWRFLESPRRAIRAVIAMVGLYVVMTAGLLALGGGQYVESVFTYHMQKKAQADDQRGKVFLRVFRFHNFYLAWATVVALSALAWWRRGPIAPARSESHTAPAGSEEDPGEGRRAKKAKRRRRVASEAARSGGWGQSGLGRFLASRQGFVIGLMLYLLAYGAWLMRLREFYDFYFLVLFAPLALLCGYGIGEMWSGVATLIRKGVIVPAVRSVILIIVLGVGYGGVKTSQLEEFPKERAKDYAWFDATSLGPVNSLYRAAVWKDRRELNRGYIGATYYLWHEMRHIEELDGVAEYVRAHSEPTDTVFGESGLAPLVAFLADRELAGHVADTNTKRFSSGQTSVAALLGKIDNPRLRFVFGSKRGGRYQYVNRMLTKWLDGNFAVVHEFRSALKPGTTWMVLERN